MLLVLDGPENAGKSTLADAVSEALRPTGWHVVRCQCRRPKTGLDATAYLDYVKLATRLDTVVILDRSWASEVVYSDLLRRDTPHDAATLEWSIGRAVDALGGRLMVLRDPVALARLHKENDHAVDPVVENAAFGAYADAWGWTAVELPPLGSRSYSIVVDGLAASMRYACGRMAVGLGAPAIAGDPYAPVAVVGERRNVTAKSCGALDWLPFTGVGTGWMRLAAGTFDDVLWTNALDVEKVPAIADVVRRAARAIVPMGGYALRVVRALHPEAPIYPAPHPAAARRWGRLRSTYTVEWYADLFSQARKGAPKNGCSTPPECDKISV